MTFFIRWKKTVFVLSQKFPQFVPLGWLRH